MTNEKRLLSTPFSWPLSSSGRNMKIRLIKPVLPNPTAKPIPAGKEFEARMIEGCAVIPHKAGKVVEMMLLPNEWEYILEQGRLL